MDQILNDILKDTYTLTQLHTRLRSLKAVLLKQFFGGDLEQSAEELNWLSSLPKSFYEQFSKDNVYEIFEQMDKTIPTLPTLIIYITFEPNQEAIFQMGSYARKTNEAPLLLLDIKLNPTLIAGCSLSWKGRQKDYSLKAKLEEKKPEILESFKRFLR